MHVNVSPRTESGWTRKNTDCCEQVRANTDDRTGSGTPSKRRKISTSETSPVGVATKTARKYIRMHHTRSPLSATARRSLLNKLQVGEPSPSPVDLSSHFQCILELARAEYPELNIEHNSLGAIDCRGARAAVRVITRHVNLNLVTCWISPSVCVACPRESRVSRAKHRAQQLRSD